MTPQIIIRHKKQQSRGSSSKTNNFISSYSALQSVGKYRVALQTKAQSVILLILYLISEITLHIILEERTLGTLVDTEVLAPI